MKFSKHAGLHLTMKVIPRFLSGLIMVMLASQVRICAMQSMKLESRSVIRPIMQSTALSHRAEKMIRYSSLHYARYTKLASLIRQAILANRYKSRKLIRYNSSQYEIYHGFASVIRKASECAFIGDAQKKDVKLYVQQLYDEASRKHKEADKHALTLKKEFLLKLVDDDMEPFYEQVFINRNILEEYGNKAHVPSLCCDDTLSTVNKRFFLNRAFFDLFNNIPDQRKSEMRNEAFKEISRFKSSEAFEIFKDNFSSRYEILKLRPIISDADLWDDSSEIATHCAYSLMAGIDPWSHVFHLCLNDLQFDFNRPPDTEFLIAITVMKMFKDYLGNPSSFDEIYFSKIWDASPVSESFDSDSDESDEELSIHANDILCTTIENLKTNQSRLNNQNEVMHGTHPETEKTEKTREKKTFVRIPKD